MNIIGISGLAGSGKDTVADWLLEQDGFIKVSLADPIKRFAMDLWEFTYEQLWGESKYRNAPDYRYRVRSSDLEGADVDPDVFLTPRHVLQHIGTEGCRVLDHDVWIRYAIRVATRLLEAKPREYCYSQSGGLEPYVSCYPQGEFETLEDFPEKVTAVIIPDVRFKNEVEQIQEAGGKLVRVVRPGAGLEGNFALHQSEAEMASIPDRDFDVVIRNTGTLEDLKRNVEDFVATLKA